MSVRTVGGTVQGANGTALASVPVVIELVLAEAFVVVGSYSVGNKLTLQTGADGSWTTPLQCNDELTPVGTLYQVTEKIPGAYGGAKVYLIQVVSGLPVSPTVNQVLNLIVPQAVPVGGTYSPVGSGPQGIAGPTGPPGYVVVANNTALNALTKVEGLPIWVANTECAWVWNGVSYQLTNVPIFADQASADAAFNTVTMHKGQPFYLQTGGNLEGPMWRNSNNSYTRPWHMPWGMVTSIFGTANGLGITTSPGNVMNLPVTVLTRRRQYLFTVNLRAVLSTANNSIRATMSGFIPPVPVTNTTLVLDVYVSVVANLHGSLMAQEPFTVSVDGNYGLGLSLQVPTGTGSYWTDLGSHMRIDDIGPAGAPL